MKALLNAALIVVSLLATTVYAENLDELLAKIDSDIAAKRLSSPASNNAIDKIWQFKALAPYDQRINSRVYQVGEVYVALANSAISKNDPDKAQDYLDKVWSLAYLTPGLESAQDKIDAMDKRSAKKAVAQKTAPKKDDSKAREAADRKARQLAQEKAAREKAEREAAERRRKQAEARERALAQKRREEEAKRKAAEKLAMLKQQRERATEIRAGEIDVETKPIAEFALNQALIDGRERGEIRDELEPICQEILDNQASVVLNTRSLQDYRWLTVRLTLCVRRLDKSFRLRHSFNQVPDTEPYISLHPGRSMSLYKKTRS
ncbi:hypothetical protein HF888_03525 [Bermanella marisrubri]|uniref:Uncharacterized protein n=1 Tax=Bermanella marisrubri TaxID=207949 RepID=Q1N0B7_9GAMM|nr:hypothetical protein [Bermanella marisrubri]EAT11600.1 hypothetical protein RED65_07924 [Oceanobacter sp. RED65] [Bermanella marisrubri]QIZ83355.1 hypothetical protein HF888_03525 [Bermanella marisrubri]